jgi:hypothetical protein
MSGGCASRLGDQVKGPLAVVEVVHRVALLAKPSGKAVTSRQPSLRRGLDLEARSLRIRRVERGRVVGSPRRQGIGEVLGEVDAPRAMLPPVSHRAWHS